MLIGQVVNKMPAPHVRKSDPSLVDPETLLGIEVEVEGCRKALPSKDKESAYWEAKEDHSLRNNGMEFVFREPLFGTDVVLALQYLFNKAEENNWKISERTGIHVHVDMRNMELNKFQNFCILYALMEPAIYAWVGDGRDRNIHCLPWYTADADLDTIGAVFCKPTLAVGLLRGISRYSGLNLNSLQQFGTVEFRHLKTTFNYTRILDWLNIILALRTQAVAWQGTPHGLIKEMRVVGAYGFMHKIFGATMTPKLWRPDFEVLFKGTSLPVAQHLAQVASPQSQGDLAKRFEAHVKNDMEECGDHPGLKLWKEKQAKKPKLERVLRTKGITTSSVNPWPLVFAEAEAGLTYPGSPSAYAQNANMLASPHVGAVMSAEPMEIEFDHDEQEHEEEDNSY